MTRLILQHTCQTMIFGVVLLASGCSNGDTSRDELGPLQEVYHHAETLQSIQGFPGPADLAILLDTADAPVVDSNDYGADGKQIFSETWLKVVAKGFSSTDVEDALELENRFEEWRLVSARVTPCSPIGTQPSQDIDTYCWPAVRLVWQPVVEDFQMPWGTTVDFFADDRAIHAIYPTHPRTIAGTRIQTDVLDRVAEILESGFLPSEELTSSFVEHQHATATALMSKLYELRSPALSSADYEELSLRPETLLSMDELVGFRTRLLAFLGEFARQEDLHELTAFSLPEGRNPAGSDIWVFLQFFAESGVLTQSPLGVISRNTGEQLVKIGDSQTVGMGVEDVTVEDELEAGNAELEESLIISPEDIAAKGAAMSDPYQFLVPNTSCASCHRLNDLRFDFHSLSGFEDRGITVSPRVVKDVERDMDWYANLPL